MKNDFLLTSIPFSYFIELDCEFAHPVCVRDGCASTPRMGKRKSHS